MSNLDKALNNKLIIEEIFGKETAIEFLDFYNSISKDDNDDFHKNLIELHFIENTRVILESISKIRNYHDFPILWNKILKVSYDEAYPTEDGILYDYPDSYLCYNGYISCIKDYQDRFYNLPKDYIFSEYLREKYPEVDFDQSDEEAQEQLKALLEN